MQRVRYWVIFNAFLLSADFFQNHFFPKKTFMNTTRKSNSLDPDQDRHFVGPDMGQTFCKGYQQTTVNLLPPVQTVLSLL